MAKGKVERALILSGGGGRGAYQVGVCQILEELGWQPDLVLGNSIGATNGALLLAPRQPVSGAALLDTVWRNEMDNSQLHQVSQQWPPLLAELMGLVIGVLQELQTPPDLTSSADTSFSLSSPSLLSGIKSLFAEGDVPRRLSARLLNGVRAPFEEGLRHTMVMARKGWRQLIERHVDFDKLNHMQTPCFGIAVTDVATGALHFFWNRVPDGVQGVASPLTVDHVMASSSIPGFYAATQVEGRYWWDGALVANTPIAPAVAAGAEDIIVVLMTPWFDDMSAQGLALREARPTVLDALDRVLDWMMLATFQAEWNRLTSAQRARIKIIAPHKPLGLVSIIDYAAMDNATLIAHGVRDARSVLGGS